MERPSRELTEDSLVALQAGGYSHPWKSSYVIAQLLVGILLIIAFVIWEWKICKDPMVPHEMFAGQRIVGMAYGIAFIAGRAGLSRWRDPLSEKLTGGGGI